MSARLVIMGVAGSGKSRIGALLAERLGAVYVDGDDLHPAPNIAKMRAGTPLTDDDRWPWLDRVGARLSAGGPDTIIGCSALKRAYRDRIRRLAGQVTFVHLTGDRALIAERMDQREGHFMPTSLIDSQFAALEPPGPDEAHVSVPIDRAPERIVDDIVQRLGDGIPS